MERRVQTNEESDDTVKVRINFKGYTQNGGEIKGTVRRSGQGCDGYVEYVELPQDLAKFDAEMSKRAMGIRKGILQRIGLQKKTSMTAKRKQDTLAFAAKLSSSDMERR